jgi:hypothetical protein
LKLFWESIKRKKVPEKKIIKPNVIITQEVILLLIGAFITFSYKRRSDEFNINIDSNPDGIESN